jgi:hypothetical protein
MSIIAELRNAGEINLKKAEEIKERIERLSYEKKVADAQGDVDLANKIQIEININAEMAKVLVDEMRHITQQITAETKPYRDRVAERTERIKSIDNLAKILLGVAVLSFLGIFVGFSAGLVVFFLAIIISIPVYLYGRKLQLENIDDLHRASGKNESMVAALRDKLKAELKLDSSVSDMENSANKMRNASTHEDRVKYEADYKSALASIERSKINLNDASTRVSNLEQHNQQFSSTSYVNISKYNQDSSGDVGGTLEVPEIPELINDMNKLRANSKDEQKSTIPLIATKVKEKKSESNLIRNRLIIGSVLLLVGGAYYINKSSEDPKITALIKKTNTAVFECREDRIESSCNVAIEMFKELESKGYCHGRDNEPRSDHRWHKCEKNSYR